MTPQGDSAPAWLFSFVDLAFLLLIAMTQLAADPNAEDLRLAEVPVPQIGEGSTNDLPAGASDRWQLRVHPPAQGEFPFELMRPAADPPVAALRLDELALRERLTALRDDGSDKPILAPHSDSRSQDLLDAATLIEEGWPGRRRAIVLPVFARR
jgi:hypothetical protein